MQACRKLTMVPARSRFAFENGLLMDVLTQLAAARSMYIAPGMHMAWLRPSSGPINIAPVVRPASPVTTAKAITTDQPMRRSRKGVSVESKGDENLPTAAKPHYTVMELATLWGWSRNTITRQFANEPGVLRLENSGTGKRKYVSLSIPVHVADRVHTRISNQPLESFGPIDVASASRGRSMRA